MPLRAMAAELGAARRMHDRTMQTHLFDAHRTVTEYEATWEAWRDGRVSRGHVSVIVDSGSNLTGPDARAAYEAEVLAYAETTSPARVRSFAQQVAEKHDPATIQERHDDALTTRRVWVEDLTDGMSMLGVIGPSVEIHGVHDRLTQQGRAIKNADRAAADADTSAAGEVDTTDGATNGVDAGLGVGEVWFDERTLDQIRTDLVLDMLLVGAPAVDPTSGDVEGGLGAIRVHVQVTIPATTLTGTTTGGAQLDGRCAIDPATARILTGNAPGFDRVFLHSVTSAVLAVDRRSTTAAQKRFLTARDIRCRFPGCRRPARHCDWDHREDYAAGGATDVENLGALRLSHEWWRLVCATAWGWPGGSRLLASIHR